ncbi:anhydro-N-acetylmuramic acid kinase [Flexithrix dorotheae]|uniref:anhydro-N-acetylmuramic acid kinase n=1 Tax=Flexithrix dorotheae TaxID=70993 RepID=UPI000362FDB0|nr:anhydro-N-acetylmuramic acid kinase [Flexithrix dorotheae]
MTQNSYKVIGVMSGTSLDGIDLAYCEFKLANGKWNYQILKAETFPYSQDWMAQLASIENKSALEYAKFDVDLGRHLGKTIASFVQKHQLSVDFIGSHGHTIYHQPEIQLTTQIGSGAQIAAQTQIPVVYDFRILDLALGGQGAPLVPIGDQLLFSDYQFCLNLGGIANISTESKGNRIAFDICPCNMVLNYLSQKENLSYDDGGKNAENGKFISTLFEALENLDFYKNNEPKSLGKEWVLETVIPLIEKYKDYAHWDIAHTFTHHIASQIANSVKINQEQKDKGSQEKLLITGGGAYHAFLIRTLGKLLPEVKIEIPSREIIEFKEAMIFGFLATLRWRNEINCLSSVTGASKDSSSGVILKV